LEQIKDKRKRQAGFAGAREGQQTLWVFGLVFLRELEENIRHRWEQIPRNEKLLLFTTQRLRGQGWEDRAGQRPRRHRLAQRRRPPVPSDSSGTVCGVSCEENSPSLALLRVHSKKQSTTSLNQMINLEA